MDEQLPDHDDVDLEVPLAWHTLDIPVAVPDSIPAEDLLVVGQGQTSGSPQGGPPYWITVDVAPATAAGSGHGQLDWTLVTRARRGIRPTGPPHIDALTLDADISTIAADAVLRLLSRGIAPDLSADERQLQVDHCWERSQQLKESFTMLDAASSPWKRAVVSVDGQDFAWWVYRSDGGWAAAADLGMVMVTAFGAGEEPSWSLTLLPAAVAVQTLPVGP